MYSVARIRNGKYAEREYANKGEAQKALQTFVNAGLPTAFGTRSEVKYYNSDQSDWFAQWFIPVVESDETYWEGSSVGYHVLKEWEEMTTRCCFLTTTDDGREMINCRRLDIIPLRRKIFITEYAVDNGEFISQQYNIPEKYNEWQFSEYVNGEYVEHASYRIDQ